MDNLVKSDPEVYLPEDVKSDIHSFAQQRLKESEAFYRSVAGKLKLDPKIFEDLSTIDHVQLEDLIEKAKQKGEEMNAARKKSYVKKSGKHIVDFAHSLRGVLVGYAELKSIISGVGPPFSQIAYGGLHVLLQVGIHKVQREDAIKETLYNLSMVMPRMRQYHVSLQHRQEDQSMWKHLVSLYVAAMEFPAAAIKYYTQSSIKRNMRLLYKPEQLVKETAGRITNLLDMVDQQAIGEIFFMQRQHGYTLQRIASDTQHGRAKLHKDQEDQHKREIAQVLRWFKLSEHDCAASTRHDLTKLLSGTFAKAPRRPGRKDRCLQEITIDSLLQIAEYTRWIASSLSALLVLSGSNYDSHPSRTGLCWLSPAITAAAATLNETCTTVYPPRSVNRHSTGTASTAIATAVFQLMHMDTRLCAEVFDLFNSRANKRVWSEAPLTDLMAHMDKAIECSSAPTVFLLFDRIDLLDDASPREFIVLLLKLVRPQAKVVKILVTVDGAAWRGDEALLAGNNGEALRDGLGDDQLLLKLQWTQTELHSPDQPRQEGRKG
ncbi:hypothetical protein OPT61_g9116 [Boeremia exigua]|uniref:Uncharacterized protein n=1 Tax=Boeremia exigua TaxID=749465 RepID=A0ACC2HVG2_9PLEO|nr:hypothetical protein OPT61_g9116 [Boeremia exigua]